MSRVTRDHHASLLEVDFSPSFSIIIRLAIRLLPPVLPFRIVIFYSLSQENVGLLLRYVDMRYDVTV